MRVASVFLETNPVHPANEATRHSGGLKNEPARHATEFSGAELVAELLDSRRLRPKPLPSPARCLPHLTRLAWDHILLTGEHRRRLVE